MLIGIFSDAHGNETGFYKCYDFLLQHCESIYYLGDAVGYFPLSNKIIDTLRTGNIHCLKGNHDAMLLQELEYDAGREQIYQIANCRKAITGENLDFIKKLLPESKKTIDNRKLLFVHGSPDNPLNGYVYPDTNIDYFADLPYDAIFMGHTHRAFIKKENNKMIVNAGSCGLPRDAGNVLTVCMYDTKNNEATIQELEMDTQETREVYGSRIHPSVINVLMRNNKIFDNE